MRSKNFLFLAPTWYRVVQEAYSTQSGSQLNYFSPKPENGAERYAPDLDATYFELLLPALARPVAKAQMDAYRLVNLNWSYTELSDIGAGFCNLRYGNGWNLADACHRKRKPCGGIPLCGQGTTVGPFAGIIRSCKLR